MKDSDSRLDAAAVVFGGIILFVGGYYFLRNTLGWDLGELNGDALWPIIVIAVGVAILLRATRRLRTDDTST